MRNRCVRFLSFGAFALTVAVLPLAGCTTGSLIGSSSFGSNKLQVADISNQSNVTPEGALTQARSHFRNNDFGYSAAYYKRLVEMSPTNPEGYVGLGASYDRLGRFDLADRVYSALFKLTGGTTQYYNNVGYSYMLRGNLKLALTNFRQAANLDPTNVIVANNLQLLADAASAARA